MRCRSCGADVDPRAAACPSCGHVETDVTRAAPAASDVTVFAESEVTVLVDEDETRIGTGSTAAHQVQSSTGPLEIGSAFGHRYHIIQVLGIGGMGAVYQAWDAELEVALALKVIRPDMAADAGATAAIERRFKRELLLARQVTHPNVVRIHDLGEIDGIKYITMPYIKGTDLGEILTERSVLPVSEALHIARQVAAGLQAAHEAGVVHRDLKPANIMIDADSRALIMDFGIALAAPEVESTLTPREGSGFWDAGDATRLGTVIGTVECMAPEQARGERVDHRADIYAFGLILSRMLVGRRLAPGTTDAMSDLMARMVAAPPPLRQVDKNIPEPLESVVSRCLAPNPGDRYQTTSELVAALSGLDDTGALLPRPKNLLKTWRFRVTAAAVFLAVIAGTWFLDRYVLHSGATVQPDPIAVLVADAANRTGEPVFDGVLEQAVTVGIEGAPFISAYPRPGAVRIARVLKAGDRLDEATARLVAVREGIKIVLLGTVEKQGSGYVLSVRGVDPTSGNALVSSRVEARNRDGVLRAGGTLGARIRSALGDTRAADPKETFSSASLEAVSAYVRAQELSSLGRDQEAIAYFKEATERDPRFGRAYGGWAMSATRLGRREEAEELWRKALAETGRMTDRERHRLEGAYFTLVTRNYDKAIDTYRTLVRDYPADGAGHNNLAVGYVRRLEFAQALEEGRRVLQIYPGSPLYRTNYALYAMYAGDFTTAAQVAQKLVDQGQAAYDAYLPLAISAIAAGRRDEARAVYERMAEVDPSGASLASVGLADLAMAEGRGAEAVEILRRGIADDERRENPAGVVTKRIALADALGMNRDIRGAAAAARSALALEKTEAQIVPAARWLIAARQLPEAAGLRAALETPLEAQARAHGWIVAGQMALAAGKHVEAVEALRQALKLANLWLARFYLGRAYLDAGYYAEAVSEFELCLKRRGEGYAVFIDDIPTSRYVAPLHYWIGRAHEGLGLGAQAQADYQAFLASRASNASDDLTKDARARSLTLTSLPDRER